MSEILVYIAAGILFAWGIGADQVKNLVQTLSAYDGSSEAP